MTILGIIAFFFGFVGAWLLWIYVYNEKEFAKNRQSMSLAKLTKLLTPKQDLVHILLQLAISLFTGTFFVSVLSLLLSSNLAHPLLKITILSLIYLLSWALVYLAIFDIKYFEIPDVLTRNMIIILVVVNALVLFFTRELALWDSFGFKPLDNFLAAILASLFIGAIVVFTKGKGMGSGDIRLAAIMGLVLGSRGTLFAFYVMILCAALVGIIYAMIIGRFRKVRIPLVPFITLGILCNMMFSSQFNSLFERLFYL